MEKLRDEAAKSMGRSKEDLSDMEAGCLALQAMKCVGMSQVERLNMDGARDAAKEAAREQPQFAGCAASPLCCAPLWAQVAAQQHARRRPPPPAPTPLRRARGRLVSCPLPVP